MQVDAAAQFLLAHGGGQFWLLLVIGLVALEVAVQLFRPIWARREGIAHKLKRTLLGLLVYAVAAYFCVQNHMPPVESAAISFMAGLGTMFFIKGRSRHIPSRVKRQVLARDLKPGQKYDSRKAHFDHVFPWSRGGSNTVDNLRLIPKKENLKKGARRPRREDWN